MIVKPFKTSLLLLLLLSYTFLNAQPVRIAVAANAKGLMKKLQVDFKKHTGIETEIIIGASGKLTTQIMNGAPYDVFLSADTEFPELLYKAGFGLKKPAIFAMGSLIVCGDASLDIKNWTSILGSEKIKNIAIANPKTAPYGKAAEEALHFHRLEKQIKSKLIYGESISQVNTYIQTGTVAIGFTTESFLYESTDKTKLKWTRVDQKSYSPIAQSAILLSFAKKGKLNEATKFFEYLSSASARAIIAKSGYHLPARKN